MTPEEFLEKIKRIEWMYESDTEMMHSELDVAMENLLVELGYGEAIEYVKRLEKVVCVMTPQEAALRLREWYQAFKNFGKGNERTVHEFLEAADLIESLAADLEDMTARYKIADDCAKKKGEMNEKLYAELNAVKAERDAAGETIKKFLQMDAMRGVQKEE